MRRALLLLPLLSACESPTAVPLPSNAVRFAPPTVYREWWTRTEVCSGRQGSYDAVSWYVIPDAWVLPGPEHYAGEWLASGNRIVLAGRATTWGDLVRHEMLHALLRAGGHPRKEFIVRCGGVVVCEEDCLAEAGRAGAAPTGAVVVPPNAIDVRVQVSPTAPSSAIWDGFLMMSVTARNAAPVPVMVNLPPPGDVGPPVSFSFRLQGGGYTEWYDMRADAPEDTWFAPGETKQFIFDFRIGTPGDSITWTDGGGSRYDLQPGTYQFSGSYGGTWAITPPTVTVGP